MSNKKDQFSKIWNINLSTEEEKGKLGDRLQSLIGKESGRKFAARAGITYSTLHNYLINKSSPTLDNLVKLAEITNVDLNWLARGDSVQNTNTTFKIGNNTDVNGMSSSNTPICATNCYSVPQYNIKTDVEDNDTITTSLISLDMHWITAILQIDPIGLVSLEAKDDSMSPEINDKDMVLVNTQDTTLGHGIYVLQTHGSLIIRRIQMLFNNHIKITSSNPIYDPIQLNINQLPSDFSVVGRVVWFGRTVP